MTQNAQNAYHFEFSYDRIDIESRINRHSISASMFGGQLRTLNQRDMITIHVRSSREFIHNWCYYENQEYVPSLHAVAEISQYFFNDAYVTVQLMIEGIRG